MMAVTSPAKEKYDLLINTINDHFLVRDAAVYYEPRYFRHSLMVTGIDGSSKETVLDDGVPLLNPILYIPKETIQSVAEMCVGYLEEMEHET